MAKRIKVGPHAIYTTGEAAELCGVSQNTIIKQFDQGALKGFRVPNSRFRRIPRRDLLVFMVANGLPLDRMHPLLSEERAIVEAGAKAA